MGAPGRRGGRGRGGAGGKGAAGPGGKGGAKGKMGKDVVGEIFSKSIANYAAEYKKQPEGSDEIIKKLEADIAALTKPPQMASTGGNVYETHQVM